jgi:hypothetical protein
MTGVEVYHSKGFELKLTPSADQIAAKAIGNQTKLPSVEMGLEEPRQSGDCDSGYSCAYLYNVSWKPSRSHCRRFPIRAICLSGSSAPIRWKPLLGGAVWKCEKHSRRSDEPDNFFQSTLRHRQTQARWVSTSVREIEQQVGV